MNADCPNGYAPKNRALYYLTPAEERVIKAYRAKAKTAKSPQTRLLLMLRRLPNGLNLAQRTALLRTARALERRGLVTIQPNRSVNGFDVRIAGV